MLSGHGSGSLQKGVLKAFRTKRIVTKVHVHLGLTCMMKSVWVKELASCFMLRKRMKHCLARGSHSISHTC